MSMSNLSDFKSQRTQSEASMHMLGGHSGHSRAGTSMIASLV